MRLEGRPAIEAFINQAGLITLKQEDESGGDPGVVCMLPTDVPKIVEWLEYLAGEYGPAEDEEVEIER